ncbi:MAG: hypothetical protein FWE82_07690 [Defluviitaleaceae bacterium]|nr:hypothetical protein [Defluviitaleaceae bacterium]
MTKQLFLFAFIILIFIFTSCATKENKGNITAIIGTNVFMEKITGNDQVIKVLVEEPESKIVYMIEKNVMQISRVNTNYSKLEKILFETQGNTEAAGNCVNENIYVLTENNSGEHLVCIYDSNMKYIKSILLNDYECGKYGYIIDLLITKNNYILVFNEGIVAYSHKGKKEGLFEGAVYGAATDGQNLFFITQTSSTILNRVDNLKTFSLAWSVDVNISPDSNYIPLSYGENKNLLLLPINQHGVIYAYGRDGKYVGEALDLYECEMFADELIKNDGRLWTVFNTVYMNKAGALEVSMLLLYDDFHSSHVYFNADIYVNEEAETAIAGRLDGKSILTVRGNYINSVNWKYPILLYEKMHPEIKIKIYSYESFAVTDYTVMTTTELMAGVSSGWDVLSMTGLPAILYAEKGLLANWYDIEGTEPFRDGSEYTPHMIDISRVDGKIYFLPVVSFGDYIYAHTGHPLFGEIEAASKTWTWSDLAYYMDNVGEDFAPVEMNMNYYGAVDSGWFNQISGLILYVTTPLFYNRSTDRAVLFAAAEESMENLGLFVGKNYFDINEKPGAFILRVFMPDELAVSPRINDLLEYTPLPLPVGSDGMRSVTLSEGYMIMESSGLKKEAAEFIRFLTDFNKRRHMNSTRVNRVDDFMQMFDEMDDWLFENGKPERGSLEAFLRKHDIASSYFNNACDYDIAFSASLLEAAYAYFNGALSKQAAIEEITDKLWVRNNQ